jgi:hypothetical protein
LIDWILRSRKICGKAIAGYLLPGGARCLDVKGPDCLTINVEKGNNVAVMELIFLINPQAKSSGNVEI